MKLLPLPSKLSQTESDCNSLSKKPKLGTTLYYALFLFPSFAEQREFFTPSTTLNKHLWRAIKHNTINFWPPFPPFIHHRSGKTRLEYRHTYLRIHRVAPSASDRPKHPIEEEVVNQSAGNKTTFSRGRLLCSDDNNGRMHLCVQGASM